MEYSPEILAAVAVLDKDQPGWHRKIDLDILSLGSCSNCVIGQSYGDGAGMPFNRGRDRLIARGYVPGHGVFALPNYEPQWRALISERVAADSIGSNLSIPDPREEAVEGFARVTV